ncbi:MAG TPA: [FeFe] hydrogenase H-cluster radical SAM maturase HydE [Candidatus Latescibacteria bacterium]|nr:[FeFe] hydrogenase H-cluster radical SAM maturase HydE [Candidatus Latescibacterota bacterium]
MSGVPRLTRGDILRWLKENDRVQLAQLWEWADAVRHEFVGDEVHLRGLIEFSNYCSRQCAYCGLNARNADVVRYRMSADEILACAHQAVGFGYGTVVLQSGEDYGVTREWLGEVVRRIKAETPLAVTLSVGERTEAELAYWKDCGADRYLLRFETSNRALYDRIHPPRAGIHSDRPALLRYLRSIGYEIGSGVMIGIPGQTYEDLANDIELFRELDLDMIGVGPFLPHEKTPLGKEEEQLWAPLGEQVPNSELMTYKVVALTRLVCPYANIPSTTALATVNTKNGRELGLKRGANIVMPNVTPPQYREKYEIYPAKACIRETADMCHQCMKHRIESIGRQIGKGRGDSPNRTTRRD